MHVLESFKLHHLVDASTPSQRADPPDVGGLTAAAQERPATEEKTKKT